MESSLNKKSEYIKRITFELLEDAQKENVKYIEVRFAPLLHLNGGLSVDDVIQSAIDGINEAEKNPDASMRGLYAVQAQEGTHPDRQPG